MKTGKAEPETRDARHNGPRAAPAPQSAPPRGRILPLGGLAGGCSSHDTTTGGLAAADGPAVATEEEIREILLT